MTSIAGGKTKAPISSHPAFPAVVALWFAALLGLGSLVLPVVLLEKAVALSGLEALVPAAQPPLGMTARALVALAAAGVGVLAGLIVARRVVSAQAAERAAPDLEWASELEDKRPISASEELGVSRLDDPVYESESPAEELPEPISGRRRPLLLAEDDTPNDFFGHAPLPGSAPFAPPARDELDLGAFLEAEAEPEAADDLANRSFDGPTAEIDGEGPDFARQGFPAPSPLPQPAGETADRAEEPPAEPQFEETPMPDLNPGSPAPSFEEPHQPAGEGLRSRPLGELGMVELVERFALSLQRRTEIDAERRDGALELPCLRDRFAEPAAEPGETGEWDRSAPAIPAALRPIDFEGEYEDDEYGDAAEEGEAAGLPSFTLPLDSPAELAPCADQAANENREADVHQAVTASPDEEPDDSARYSSLLAMKRPLNAGRHPASGPEAAFPGQMRPAAPASDGPSRDAISQPHRADWHLSPTGGPEDEQSAYPSGLQAPPKADSGETERALRSALERLQQMSGAA